MYCSNSYCTYCICEASLIDKLKYLTYQRMKLSPIILTDCNEWALDYEEFHLTVILITCMMLVNLCWWNKVRVEVYDKWLEYTQINMYENYQQSDFNSFLRYSLCIIRAPIINYLFPILVWQWNPCGQVAIIIIMYYYAIQQQISQAKNTTPYESINKSMILLVWFYSGNFSVDTTVIH